MKNPKSFFWLCVFRSIAHPPPVLLIIYGTVLTLFYFHCRSSFPFLSLQLLLLFLPFSSPLFLFLFPSPFYLMKGFEGGLSLSQMCVCGCGCEVRGDLGVYDMYVCVYYVCMYVCDYEL